MMKKWTFVTNHGAVLAYIARRIKVKALDIAIDLNLTERTVRRIIADLVEEGYVEKIREGNINRYHLNDHMRLRRSKMTHVEVKKLIKVLMTQMR